MLLSKQVKHDIHRSARANDEGWLVVLYRCSEEPGGRREDVRGPRHYYSCVSQSEMIEK